MNNVLALAAAWTVAAILAILVVLLLLALVFRFGSLWVQAYMTGANVTFASLVAMSLRRVNPAMVVQAKVMGCQAGLDIDQMSTAALETHALAGGDVMRVVRSIIAARQAGLNLDFDRSAAIDLAGRDILDAVRTSVSPKVIDCPEIRQHGKRVLSAIARDGVELRVHARVTVRTSLDQLIGGATEETIVARVGQGIVSAIGSALTHMQVMAQPDRISKNVLDRRIDANSAFEIVSIDIAGIDVGENVGARLQSEQAEADMRMAQAMAESRLAEATAFGQEMLAEVVARKAERLLAESRIPVELAEAFRRGQFTVDRQSESGYPKIRRPA
jgi:uncharacterized protein YqfA (UPF0365 family)